MGLVSVGGTSVWRVTVVDVNGGTSVGLVTVSGTVELADVDDAGVPTCQL